MKARSIFILSFVLNVVLAIAVFFPKQKILPMHGMMKTSPSAIASESSLPKDVLKNDGTFRWSQIVSDDLKAYHDNLRAIGCPEMTTLEIMRAVINENFSARRREILSAAQDNYWEMVRRGELMRRQFLPETDWAKALASLTEERRQTLLDVLGVNETDVQERQLQRKQREQSLAWLPADKRAQLLELEEQHQKRLDDWTAALGSRAPSPEEQAQADQWQQELDAAKTNLLSPAEQKEMQLRESDVADWAANLPGFSPSEDEWRSLTALRLQFEQSHNNLNEAQTDDSEKQSQQNQLQANFDAAVQAALGPDRFAQYQLANNDQYQALHKVTQRYGLPDDVVNQSLQVQQAAQNAAGQIRANSNLSPDQQQAALNAIQQQTEQTLSQILGNKVLSTYKEYGGDWLDGLGCTDAN